MEFLLKNMIQELRSRFLPYRDIMEDGLRRLFSSYEALPNPLLENWRNLRQRALQSAELDSKIPNYVVLRWANKKDFIDSEAEAQAAEILAHKFKDTNLDYILAIANSGLPIGQAVHKRFPNTTFIEATKFEKEPEREDGSVYTQAHSYSRDTDFWFKIPQIPQGKRVLIIDDVAAYAGVGLPIAQLIKDQGGLLVGYGVYFDKVFQGGLKKISQKLNIPAFSVIRVKSIEDHGITLLDEKSSLKPIYDHHR